MTAEDPRVTAARAMLAEIDWALDTTDPEDLPWTPEAIADRHVRLTAALADLIDYIDEQGTS